MRNDRRLWRSDFYMPAKSGNGDSPRFAEGGGADTRKFVFFTSFAVAVAFIS